VEAPGLNVLDELFGLHGALDSRAMVVGEIYSGACNVKLPEHLSDFFLVLGRAHPKDTTATFLPKKNV
jgi:hypothetical protein